MTKTTQCRDCDLSIIVQGAVGPDTKEALNNARKSFPQAEIILSTWMNSDVSGLCFDKVAFNVDPGATASNNRGTPNNLNRQIVSTLSGLKLASRNLSLKTRTDLIFKNNKILSEWGKFPHRVTEWAFFQDRVLASAIYARRKFFRGGLTAPALFHPSDLIFFGRTTDLLAMYDIPLVEEPLFSEYFLSASKPNINEDPYPENWARLFPEQYIWHSFISKFIDIPWKHRLEYTNSLHKISELSLINNFVFLDLAQSGFVLPKHHLFRQEYMNPMDLGTLYDHFRFRIDYWRFCHRGTLPFPTRTFLGSVPFLAISKIFQAYPPLYFFLRNIWRRGKKSLPTL